MKKGEVFMNLGYLSFVHPEIAVVGSFVVGILILFVVLKRKEIARMPFSMV